MSTIRKLLVISLTLSQFFRQIFCKSIRIALNNRLLYGLVDMIQVNIHKHSTTALRQRYYASNFNSHPSSLYFKMLWLRWFPYAANTAQIAPHPSVNIAELLRKGSATEYVMAAYLYNFVYIVSRIVAKISILSCKIFLRSFF